MSIMPAPDLEQGELFTPKPFQVMKENVGLRGASQFPISSDVAAELKRIDGTDELIPLTIYVSAKGYTKEYDAVTWNVLVSDLTLAD